MAVCQTSKDMSVGGASQARPGSLVSSYAASLQQSQQAVPRFLLCIVLIAREPVFPSIGPLLLPRLLIHHSHPSLSLPQLLQVLGALEQAQVVQPHQVCGMFVMAQLAHVMA
eukprot:1158376-Pelagomonas_calceolata.AAC.11